MIWWQPSHIATFFDPRFASCAWAVPVTPESTPARARARIRALFIVSSSLEKGLTEGRIRTRPARGAARCAAIIGPDLILERPSPAAGITRPLAKTAMKFEGSSNYVATP